MKSLIILSLILGASSGFAQEKRKENKKGRTHVIDFKADPTDPYSRPIRHDSVIDIREVLMDRGVDLKGKEISYVSAAVKPKRGSDRDRNAKKMVTLFIGENESQVKLKSTPKLFMKPSLDNVLSTYQIAKFDKSKTGQGNGFGPAKGKQEDKDWLLGVDRDTRIADISIVLAQKEIKAIKTLCQSTESHRSNNRVVCELPPKAKVKFAQVRSLSKKKSACVKNRNYEITDDQIEVWGGCKALVTMNYQLGSGHKVNSGINLVYGDPESNSYTFKANQKLLYLAAVEDNSGAICSEIEPNIFNLPGMSTRKWTRIEKTDGTIVVKIGHRCNIKLNALTKNKKK